jgi:hypothetical protein
VIEFMKRREFSTRRGPWPLAGARSKLPDDA